MTNRIQELEKQTWVEISRLGTVRWSDWRDKFAELIIRECAEIAHTFDEPKLSGPGLMVGNMIEYHFGVCDE